MTKAPSLRASNRSRVLAELLAGAELERTQLAESTGLSRATVFRVVDDLLAAQLLLERSAPQKSGPGRPATTVRLNPSAMLIAGIDLGGTNCRIAVADALGNALIRGRFKTPRELDAAAFAAWLGDRVTELVAEHGQGIPLGSVALGVPGAVSGDRTRILGAHNLPQMLGTEFVQAVEAVFDVPVHIDNDSNLALYGELVCGSLDGSASAVLLALGTGLGTAAAREGRVLAGPDGALGEFGRLRIPGRTERLRDLVSGAGLAAYAKSRGADIDTAADLFADPVRHADILDDVHEALLHLVSLVTLAYEPATIVIAGGFADAFDDSILDRLHAEVIDMINVDTRIRRSELGGAAGLLGAMAAALSQLHASVGVLTEHATLVPVERQRIIQALAASPTTA